MLSIVRESNQNPDLNHLTKLPSPKVLLYKEGFLLHRRLWFWRLWWRGRHCWRSPPWALSSSSLYFYDNGSAPPNQVKRCKSSYWSWWSHHRPLGNFIDMHDHMNDIHDFLYALLHLLDFMHSSSSSGIVYIFYICHATVSSSSGILYVFCICHVTVSSITYDYVLMFVMDNFLWFGWFHVLTDEWLWFMNNNAYECFTNDVYGCFMDDEHVSLRNTWGLLFVPTILLQVFFYPFSNLYPLNYFWRWQRGSNIHLTFFLECSSDLKMFINFSKHVSQQNAIMYAYI